MNRSKKTITSQKLHVSGKHLAHSRSEEGHEDYLCAHLQNVAGRAAIFAQPFGAHNEASLCGLLHDLGKYGHLFQRRLQGKEHGIDHWSAGAWTALMKYKSQGLAAALAIQGHHVGLQQASKDSLSALNPETLNRCHPMSLRLSDSDISSLLQCLEGDGLSLPAPENIKTSLYGGLQEPPAAGMLDVRMLFSALVDADFIETEAHFLRHPDGRKSYRALGPTLDSERSLSFLMFHLESIATKSRASLSMNQLRADLLAACLEAADLPQGLFTLTSPTGTGKTFSMLAFALRHAAKHKLRRIVMVIPYLNIIEQTALEYKNVFKNRFSLGALNRYILEHHSLTGICVAKAKDSKGETDMENESLRRTRLLAENWDAPIIITTSVQFLQSLLANRPSVCRKLHNLAKSVILLDEVQTLPVSLAIPTLATLSHLSNKGYGSTIVFSTATQPAFAHLNDFVRRYCTSGWRPKEIVPHSLGLFDRAKRARRTEIEWVEGLKRPLLWADLAKQLTQERQALCVVNLKRHALHLLDEIQSRKAADVFHLSTNMCPAHRLRVLDEVRSRLRPENSQPCILVSTQCIEAGVDVDFPVVFRAFGPLDAIAQAAGRCNRNCRSEVGKVLIFLPEEEAYPDGAYRQATAATQILFKKHGILGLDIYDPTLFKEYYEELYSFARPQDQNQEIQAAIKRQDFVEVARLYRIISKDAINVLVPYDPMAFQNLAEEVRKDGLTGRWISKARPHTISLFKPKQDDSIFDYLDPISISTNAFSEGWFIYLNIKHYDPLKGLCPPSSMECIIA